MDPSIVQVKNDVLAFVLWVVAHSNQHLLDEVLKHSRVYST